jgi:hypothetical protein
MTMSLDPTAAPSPVTPADSPSAPELFAGVTPHGQGTAPYDVQADQADFSGLAAAAVAAVGPRQEETRGLLESAEGFGSAGYAIASGSSGGGGDDWPSDVRPGH